MASWTRRGAVCAFALVPMLLVVVAGPVRADDTQPAPEPAVGVIGADLSDANGPIDVVLRLSRPALAEAVAPNATRLGSLPDAATQQAIVQSAEDQQHEVLAAAARPRGHRARLGVALAERGHRPHRRRRHR